MAVTAIFPTGGFSPVPRPPLAGKSKRTKPIFPAAGKVRSGTPPSAAAGKGRMGKEVEESERERRGLRLYCEQAKEMLKAGSDGGPPRWFSPLECAPAARGGPMLLYLPGADGVGLGLVMHHEKLAKMFDVWCLHIPPMDRTPFTELVKLVEETVRSQNQRPPNSPVYLVGESLGGCLAMAIAACNPDVDCVLVLANPAASFNQSLLEPLLPLMEAMPDRARPSLSSALSLMTALAGQSSGMAVPQRSRDSLQHTVGELSRDLIAISSYLSVLDRTLPKEALLWKLKLLKEASAYANSRLHAVTAQTLILLRMVVLTWLL